MIKLHQLKFVIDNFYEVKHVKKRLCNFNKPFINEISTSSKHNCKETSDKLPKTINKKLELEVVNKKEMVQFLNRLRLSYQENYTCLSTSCLKHSRSKLKLDCLSKVHINTTTGYFVCENCMRAGSWNQFVESSLEFENILNNKKRLPSMCFREDSCTESITDNKENKEAQDIYMNSVPIDKCDKDKLNRLLIDLDMQHLQTSTLNAFNVRASKDLCSLILPLYSFKNTLVAVKILTVETIADAPIVLNTDLITDQTNSGNFDEGLKDGSSDETLPTASGVTTSGVTNDLKTSDNVENITEVTDKEQKIAINTDNQHETLEDAFKEHKTDDNVDAPSHNVDKASQNTEGVTDKDNGDVEDSIEDVCNKIIVKTTVVPSSDVCGLFGYNLLTTNKKTNSSKKSNKTPSKPHQDGVVVTSSEVDAMCVFQQTSRPSIALPKGPSVLPPKVLPLLEKCTKLILWFGGGHNSWQDMRLCAKKFNMKRCHLVRPEKGCPKEVMMRGEDLDKVVRTSKSMAHQSIITFQHLREELYVQLSDAETMAGIQWTRYPQLNNLLKGHRRGELTVMTGPTGCGKTTFMSDYSLDLSMQGVNTLWGSFEINNIKLVKTMLSQFALKDLTKSLDQFDHYADRFEKLPIFFMTFHGQENIQKVIETMSHAAYVHDITHVIVDNLQFMLGLEEGHDRFLKQDLVISAFRKFATHSNCHVTLVIHPRKERDTENLSISSIFGSAKATQEADNVLILQDNKLLMNNNRKFIQVAKNRYDGELGMIRIKFNKESLTFDCVDDNPTTPPNNQPPNNSYNNRTSITPSNNPHSNQHHSLPRLIPISKK